jgi:hypothetical protein
VLSNESQAILATQVFANEMALKRRNELWVIESGRGADAAKAPRLRAF